MSNNEGSWIDQAEHDAAKASGGGGIIAQCEMNRGFKFFLSGKDGRESFFQYNPADEASKKNAENKAKAALVALGNPIGPNNKPVRAQDGMELIVYKDSVKGKEVTWKGDRFFNYPFWTESWKVVFLPKLKELSPIPPLSKKFWGKISFVPDPSGRMKADQNGEQKAELVAFVAAVYKDEASAVADAGSTSANGSGSAEATNANVPANYSETDWLGMKNDPDPKYGIAVVVNAAIAEAEKANKGKPKPVVAKAIEAAKAQAIKELAERHEATEAQVEYALNSK